MRKSLYVAVGILLLVPASVFADEAPKAEVFGGYSLFHTISPENSLHGWNASVTGNVNSWFGVVGDFSGHYASPSLRILTVSIPTGLERTAYCFLVGPQFAYRGSNSVVPFAHVLFGGLRSSEGLFGFNYSNTAMATAIGGGIDLRLSDTIAIRAIQADYVMARSEGEVQNNVRLSAGVIFRFGN
jgi:hypothetical protein